jgi:hypothetical protein
MQFVRDRIIFKSFSVLSPASNFEKTQTHREYFLKGPHTSEVDPVKLLSSIKTTLPELSGG